MHGVIQPAPGIVGDRCGSLQDGVGRYHLPGDKIVADAEMFERALRLRAPELVGGDFD